MNQATMLKVENYFDRNPDRLYCVHHASKADIKALKAPPLPADTGMRWWIASHRNIKGYFHFIFPAPKDSEADITEEMARGAFEYAFTWHVEVRWKKKLN